MRTHAPYIPLLVLSALVSGCADEPGQTESAGFSASGSASVSVSASASAGSTSTGTSSTATEATDSADPTGMTGMTGMTAPTDPTASTDSTDPTGSSTTTGEDSDTSTGADPDDGKAFLHADLWSVWWNDRTRCGAERTFLDICQRRGDACDLYQAAVNACDPAKIIYGQVGPEKQGEPLCQRGKHPEIGGCIASDYDFDALRFTWYGAEWQGNWPFATLKLFPAGADWTSSGDELIALSSLPGAPQAAMSGIANHGLGYGCTMPGVTSGDEAYLRPFGGFAWVEVPTGEALTVVAAAATNFADNAFQGCSRGAATQDPWISGAPAAQLGCVYVEENMVFEPGKHYFWRYGQIVELAAKGPPPELIAGFGLPEVGLDVSDRSACAL